MSRLPEFAEEKNQFFILRKTDSLENIFVFYGIFVEATDYASKCAQRENLAGNRKRPEEMINTFLIC